MNDNDDLNTPYSRRALMEASLGLVGVVALCGLATTRATATEARSSTTLRYFRASEACTIDALVAQIIPTDETAGAREMGVVRFIDHALAGFLSPLAPTFRMRLADFERTAVSVMPAAMGLRRSRATSRFCGCAKSSTRRFSSPCSN